MTVRNRYMPVNVTVPAQTAIATPYTQTLNLGDVLLQRVDLKVPPGPSGLVGVFIEQAGTPIWPWGAGTPWFIGDDDDVSTDVGTEIDQGITFVAYNLDFNPHTLYFRFLVTPVALVANVAALVPIVPVA